MDLQSVNGSRDSRVPITAADLLTLSSICPACGYPSVAMGLCAYCRPLTQQAS